jgi:DNA-binding NarL/FixJ family response regulator
MNKSVTIALLDDHEMVLDGLTRTLELAGVEVLVACTSAQEFIDKVRGCLPMVCVIDLRLGDTMSGLDVIPRVLEASPRSRVAILTSSEDGRLAARAITAGATGFIVKDASTAVLSVRLRAVADGDVTIDNRVADSVLRPERAVTLSKKEVEMLRMVADGLTNQQIATRLSLSVYTIKEYLSKTMRKLDTRSRAETVARAISDGLL